MKAAIKNSILVLFILIGVYQIELLAQPVGLAELDRLKEGNNKYIGAIYNKNPIGELVRKELYEKGQKPYAIVLGCSDSRVVPEDVFYTGLGELFVIRVAGNIVDSAVLGSIEYAIEGLDIPLIVVMGHENCGAVKAVEVEEGLSGDVKKLVSKIIPSYKQAKKQGGTEQEILQHAIEFNVENSINEIKKNEVVANKLKENKVKIVGMYYNLQTGKVSLLE